MTERRSRSVVTLEEVRRSLIHIYVARSGPATFWRGNSGLLFSSYLPDSTGQHNSDSSPLAFTFPRGVERGNVRVPSSLVKSALLRLRIRRQAE